MPQFEAKAAVRELDDDQPGTRGEIGGVADRYVISAAERAELATRYETLSQREQEVLRGVAYGYTNREIADHLGISVKSVETYRYRLSEKLDFRSRAELVRFALDLGLLRAEEEGLPAVD